MDKELSEKINAAFLALEKRQKGSITKAQALTKTLRQIGERATATKLVKQTNDAARYMARQNW